MFYGIVTWARILFPDHPSPDIEIKLTVADQCIDILTSSGVSLMNCLYRFTQRSVDDLLYE